MARSSSSPRRSGKPKTQAKTKPAPRPRRVKEPRATPPVQVVPPPDAEELYEPSVEELFVEEWIDGQQFMSPRPAVPHTAVASRLGVLLGSPYMLGIGGPGGWHILDEAEIHFPEEPKKNVLVPDLSGWRIEHVTREMLLQPAFTRPPDWACEVHSDSTRRLDRGKKLHVYARAGVPYLWLIEPLSGLLEIYKLQDGPGSRYVLLDVIEAPTRPDPLDVEPFGPVRLDLLWQGIA